MQRERGFTLIELMIVITIVAVVAAIAIPNLLSARLGANETAAIATLRTLLSAQATFQSNGSADEDDDGVGEYGTFGELSAAVGVRGVNPITPPVLSTTFRSVNTYGEVSQRGYQFRIYLPDINGQGLGEEPGGGVPVGVDADLAETSWCCYAWPTNYRQSGNRTFFVNHGGQIVWTDDEDYDGPDAGIDSGAAMTAGGSVDSITGDLATGTVGRDGNFWKAVAN